VRALNFDLLQLQRRDGGDGSHATRRDRDSGRGIGGDGHHERRMRREGSTPGTAPGPRRSAARWNPMAVLRIARRHGL